MIEKTAAYFLHLVSMGTLALCRRYARGRFSSRAGNFAVAAHIVISQRLQYASRGVVRAFQEKRLRGLFGIRLDELPRHPILSKAELKARNERAPQLFPRWRYVIDETTGSTGVPLRAFRDLRYWPLNTATHSRAFLEHGSNLSEGQICIGMPLAFWRVPQNVFLLSTRDLYLNPEETANFFLKNREELKKVRVLKGYPSHFLALAKLLTERGIPVPQVDLLVYIAEELPPHDRIRLENMFGGKVYGMYGLAEAGIVGLECEKQDGYHVEEWRHIVEVVDGAGAPVPAGARGRVLVTPLWNEVMPLLRYDTGDLGMFRSELCSCGRKSPVLELIGRQSAEIALPNGRKAHMFLLDPIFRSESGVVERYQVIQHRIGEIEVKIVPTEKFAPEAESRIKDAIQKILGPDAKITISIVPSIPIAPYEKHRTFVSLICAPSRGGI